MPWLQGVREGTKAGTGRARTKPYWYIWVPTGHGSRAMSTGTSEKRLAKRMEVMVDNLYRGPRRDPEILAWLLDRTLPRDQRLKLLVLLDYYDTNRLEELKALRSARQPDSEAPAPTNVNDYVDAWYQDVRRRSSKDNADRFLAAVRSYMPAGEVFPSDRFQFEPLLHWANSLTQATEDEGLALGNETARRYRAGMYNFIQHLVNAGVLSRNPLDQISAPKKGKPRDRHLTSNDARRLIAACQDDTNQRLTDILQHHGIDVRDLKGFLAVLQGAGLEVSVALALEVRDVSPALKEVHARGTKTDFRDRHVRVADWAWPWVQACIEGRGAHDRLFSTIPDRWVAGDAFKAAIAPLVSQEPRVFQDYWMRDARHTFAVRLIKAGTPAKVVAAQLGHKDPTMVNKVYGIYMPDSAERGRWEQAAAAMDGATRIPDVQRGAASRTVRPRTKIHWPSDDELMRRLTERSTTALAEELGISDVALRKRLLRNGAKRIPDGRRGGVRGRRGRT